MTKQVHLAAHFPGVNNTTVWSDPAAGSHIEFDSFSRFAQTAERGKFDVLFLADAIGLRDQETSEQLSRSPITANLEPLALLSALSVVTSRIGLAATASTTYNEPYHIARKFASPRERAR